MEAPNIITKYNEETKQFSYVLEDREFMSWRREESCYEYNLSRLIAMPAVSDIFSSFQYRKDIVFCNSVIKNGFQRMSSKIPNNILKKFIQIMDSKASIDNMEDRFNLSNCSLSMFIEDDIAQKNIPAIFFDFNKYKPGCKKSGKIVLLDNFIITVMIYPGIEDEDHPGNNKMYTEYTIYNRHNTDKFIYSLIGVNYDTKFFMVDNFPSYPEVRDIIRNTIHLDPNHVIYHHTILYANTYNEKSFIQAIDIVKDMDYMAGIHLIDNHFNPSITKISLAISEEIPDNFKRLKSLVNYNELENSIVYDLFGKHATFKQFKDSISIRRD